MTDLLTRADYAAIAADLDLPKGCYIDGKFRPGNGPKLVTTNPATGDVLATIAAAGAEDVDFAVQKAREVFDQGDRVSALITELDPGRGRIGLNTALLEGPPGELLIEKEKVMAEAADRASRAQNTLKQQEQSAG